MKAKFLLAVALVFLGCGDESSNTNTVTSVSCTVSLMTPEKVAELTAEGENPEVIAEDEATGDIWVELCTNIGNTSEIETTTTTVTGNSVGGAS